MYLILLIVDIFINRNKLFSPIVLQGIAVVIIVVAAAAAIAIPLSMALAIQKQLQQ
jgi:hypothetical protein